MLKDNLSKRQFFKNLSVNSLNFMMNIAYGLLMTPFLIKMLGLDSFGIVQVAISFSTYIGLLTSSLNQANNRYVSISIANDQKTKTVEIINTIIFIYIVIILTLLPVVLIASYYSDVFFDISEKDILGSKLLFLSVTMSYLLVMFISVFTSPIYALNRLDIVQSINITRNFFRLALTFIFIYYISSNIACVGFSALFSSVIAVIFAMFWFKKYLPYFKLSIKYFKRELAKKVIKFSWWTIINEIGTLLFLQADILIINILLGKGKSGEYGIIFQWIMMLRNMATITSVVMSPIILIKYSKGIISELLIFIKKAVKYQGLYISLLTGLLMTFGKPIFKLWIGVEYVYLLPYLYVAIFHFSLTQSIRPLYAMNTAYNKVRGIGRLSLLFGFIHIILSIILIKNYNLGIYGSLISGAFLSIILNAIILPIYVSKYIEENLWVFINKMVPGLITQVFIIVVGVFMQNIFLISSWSSLILLGLLTLLITIIFIYFILLNHEERTDIKSIFSRRNEARN